jgi:hypothetical protein
MKKFNLKENNRYEEGGYRITKSKAKILTEEGLGEELDFVSGRGFRLFLRNDTREQTRKKQTRHHKG